MKGQKFLKITGILMIISAVFSIFAGVLVGGLGALAAGLGAASGLTFSYWVALFMTLVGGICQLIAGIKGIKHSKNSANSQKLVVWGVIVAAFSGWTPSRARRMPLQEAHRYPDATLPARPCAGRGG